MSNAAAEDTEMSFIVGQSGRYDVHKIIIDSYRAAASATTKRPPKLGLELKSKEWMSRDLSISFGGAGRNSGGGNANECTFIKQVAHRSLAEQAGVLVGDTLCHSSDQPTGVFHDLLLQAKPASSVQWQFMTVPQFQDLVTDSKDKKTSLVFFVARKKAANNSNSSTQLPPTAQSNGPHVESSSDSNNNNKISNNNAYGGVTLSREIGARAASFSSLSIEEQTILLADAQRDAKEHFEQEQDKILEVLPDAVKEKFFQIGFVQWGTRKLPAIILSPFSVPPGSNARRTWLRKFDARKAKGTLDKMNYLVYWYGEEFSIFNESNCFSILSAQDQESFVPWETAKELNLHHIPRATNNGVVIKKKIASLKAINTAARQSTLNRRDLLPRIQEFHELLCYADLAQYDERATHIVAAGTVSRGSNSASRKRSNPTINNAPRHLRIVDRKRSPQLTSLAPQPPRLQPQPVKRRKRMAHSNLNGASIIHDDDEDDDFHPLPVSSSCTPERTTARAPRATKTRISIIALKVPSSLCQRATRSSVAVSPLQDDGDDTSTDQKPMARRTMPETEIVSDPTQSAVDSYCSHVQGIICRNTMLRSEKERLESVSKIWRTKYEDLANAVDSMCCSIDHDNSETASHASAVRRGAEQAAHEIELGECHVPLKNTGDDGDDKYREKMCVYLGEIAKQNGDLERVNGRLESEVKRWSGKHQKLDVQVRRLKNVREELD